MPARSRNADPVELALMGQLGARLAAARKSRKLAAARLAAEVGVSRNTLHAAESGDGAVTLGTYMRILTALGMSADLALVAASPVADQGSSDIRRRHARLEAEVSGGLRDARSLIAIPRRLAVESHVTFPDAPFGDPQPW